MVPSRGKKITFSAPDHHDVFPHLAPCTMKEHIRQQEICEQRAISVGAAVVGRVTLSDEPGSIREYNVVNISVLDLQKHGMVDSSMKEVMGK